jgi:lipopolysaccharide export system permease protein
MIKIWERYLLKQFIQVFSLFLLCFYGLYVLIDYTSHTNTFSQQQLPIPNQEVARYYLFVFANRAEILLPLALLIAFMKTICTLNTHYELMALMVHGMKIQTLIRPFLFMGLIGVLLMYTNEEILLPHALKKLRSIENRVKHRKKQQASPLIVHDLTLEDGSLFLFQYYDATQKRFFDVYWIRSTDDIYRMKYLSLAFTLPKGLWVDHLVRQPNGELLQETSDKEFFFPDLRFNLEVLQSTILDPETLPLSDITIQATQLLSDESEKESQLLTAFYWKLIIPWLCLLAIIAPAPYCVRFSRQYPLFLLYTGSLFGFLAFYLFMDAAQIIAKRQVLSPAHAILIPFLSVAGYCSWRFLKIKSCEA